MRGLIATTWRRRSLAGRMLPLPASFSLLRPARASLWPVVRLCSTPWGRRPLASTKSRRANLVKLSGNFLITSIIDSLGETFALARKSGIDPHRFLEVLTGTLFSAPIYQTYG